jgi:hypothetical protein
MWDVKQTIGEGYDFSRATNGEHEPLQPLRFASDVSTGHRRIQSYRNGYPASPGKRPSTRNTLAPGFTSLLSMKAIAPGIAVTS